jgi:subtilisin family serine protease
LQKVKLVGLKALDATGSGSASDIIGARTILLSSQRLIPLTTSLCKISKAALQYVAIQKKSPNDKIVASLSISASASQSLDDAVGAVISNGISVVVAAGNGGQDACQVSP